MSCLGSVVYDPATAVSKSTAAALAMTAFDTTNARITFTVPASGRVMARVRANHHGGSASPWFAQCLLGVLEGTTVRMRLAPNGDMNGIVGSATAFMVCEATAVIGGLTPGASLAWDAAYGVETAQTGGALKYGGPNDATANNAFGALVFEVWEA